MLEQDYYYMSETRITALFYCSITDIESGEFGTIAFEIFGRIWAYKNDLAAEWRKI